MSSITITVTSTGSRSGPASSVVVSGNALPQPSPSAIRGLVVCVIDEFLGIIVDSRTFDTNSSTLQADVFADFIEALAPGRLVAMALAEEGSQCMTPRAKTACSLLGSAYGWRLSNQSSWAMIGQKGSAPGSATERFDALGQTVVTTASIDLPAQDPNGHMIEATSGGANTGVFKDGVPLEMAGGFQIGLNVFVFDETNGSVLSRHYFNTSNQARASDEFSAFVEGLPNQRVVAVVARDDASDQLSERAKRAIRSLGSIGIGSLVHGSSFALIGSKGVDPGQAAEVLTNGAPATARSWIVPSTADQCYYLAVRSAGYTVGNFCVLTLNGVPIDKSRDYRRGLNVAVIDESTGVPIGFSSFDTNWSARAADDFAALLESLPVGRMVLVGAMDEAAALLNERAITALRAIGSARIGSLAFRGSFALIGRKGAAPGSMPELVASDRAVCVGYCVRYSNNLAKPYVSVHVESAGYELGNRGSIVIDGTRFQTEGFYSRGINLVVLDGSNVVFADVFDVWGEPFRVADLVALINLVPVGACVALCIVDEGRRNLTEAAFLAFESLGSAYVRSLGRRDSWAFIGTKRLDTGVGDRFGKVAESISRLGPVQADAWLLNHRRPKGNGTGLNLVVNTSPWPMNWPFGVNGTHLGRTIVPAGKSGIAAVALDPASGLTMSTAFYETSVSGAEADRLAAFVEGTDPGVIMMLAICAGDGVSKLTERAWRACETLGSQYVRSLKPNNGWALIGMKGAAPGSMPEIMSADRTDATVASWLPTRIMSPAARPLLNANVINIAFLFPLIPLIISGIATIGIAMSASQVTEEPNFSLPMARIAPSRRRLHRALLIAVGYKKTELPTIGNAARAMARLRTSLGFLDAPNGDFLFSPGNIRMLSDENPDKYSLDGVASKAMFLDSLDWLVKDAKSGDVLFLAFLGHGSNPLTPNDFGYPSGGTGTVHGVITVTQRTPDEDRRDVTYDFEIWQKIRKIPSTTHLTMLLQFCYSDGIVDDVISDLAGDPTGARGISLAAVSGEVANEFNESKESVLSRFTTAIHDPALPTYTKFMQTLVAAMRESWGAATYDNNAKLHPLLRAAAGIDTGTLKLLQPLA